MASQCSFEGHPETYGLGLRLAFYTFWYTIPLRSWITRSQTKIIRFIFTALNTGYFIGLLAQTDRDSLRDVEIYVGILLVLGVYLYYLPLYVWRLLTGFKENWDPERAQKVLEGPIVRIWNWGLFGAVVIFKLWFWARVGDVRRVSSGSGCQEYAFFFGKVRFDGRGFVAGNVVLCVVLLIGWLVVGLGTCLKVSLL
jgi:hypothetical protein